MNVHVHKYGGSSVADTGRIRAVAGRIAAHWREGRRLVVVVSAMGGDTDRLCRMARGLAQHPAPRELDVLLSTGEQVTIALLAIALRERGCPARSYTGIQACIRTDGRYNKARIVEIEARRIQSDLEQGKVAVVAGFQGADPEGNITTLGRGGSDTTAVALAASLQAAECRIYTDVEGIYTADPRIEPDARLLGRIAYEEMLEMASQGARVLQTRAVEFASKYNIPLRVLSSFADGPGTLIEREREDMEQPLISGIAHNQDEAKLTLLGVPDKPGIAHEILGPIAGAGIEVDMIVQNVGENRTTDFTFTVHRRDYRQAMEILDGLAGRLGAADVRGDDGIVKIAVVGVGMRSHAGIASRMFEVLASEGINIMMISTSEIKISVVIEEKHLETGIRALHRAFGLEKAND